MNRIKVGLIGLGTIGTGVAKTLLEKHSVTETCMRLGMSSTQYFATVFRRHTNMSPSEYGRLGKLKIKN